MRYKKRSLEEKVFRLNATSVVKIVHKDEETAPIIRAAYLDLLRQYNYNISRIINYLGVSRQSFYNKLKEYDIPLSDIRKDNNKKKNKK